MGRFIAQFEALLMKLPLVPITKFFFDKDSFLRYGHILRTGVLILRFGLKY